MVYLLVMGYYLITNRQEEANILLRKKIIRSIKHIFGKNPNSVLELGNLYSKRDWGHSRDYVNGMWLMLQQEKTRRLCIGNRRKHIL